MQLALQPLQQAGLLDGMEQPRCFGVSGWSGAGTTPSRKNDPVALKDNLMPYALTGHIHEREVSTQLGSDVFFMPCVSPNFRGIQLTISAKLNEPRTMPGGGEVDGPVNYLRSMYQAVYDGEPLVKVLEEGIPEVASVAEKHHVEIGGFAMDESGTHVVISATIDNLLKGAATQAVQNLNLSLGVDEFEGIDLSQ